MAHTSTPPGASGAFDRRAFLRFAALGAGGLGMLLRQRLPARAGRRPDSRAPAAAPARPPSPVPRSRPRATSGYPVSHAGHVLAQARSAQHRELDRQRLCELPRQSGEVVAPRPPAAADR